MKTISKVIKYCDGFGASFNFYIEKNRKLYTSFGGILTLLSIIFSTIIFIYMNLDDFLHNLPNSTTSTEKEKYHRIKFKEEKIWIPWRIRDFGGKTINHTNFLFPIIYYYKGIRNNELKSMRITHEFINYRLCNETSMVNNTDYFVIDIELDQLYCIDMEDLIIGGSWDSDFLYLITFDLYGCKNGIDYDENNTNCTTYDTIFEIAGINNCLDFEIYYPVVDYQPMNKTTPIFIEYINYFYHLSRFSNKIDRLYLQQHILRDDKGWILKNEEIYSRWGSVALNGDSYATGNKKDLMNEGSTSRFYSFNIYLKPDIIYYNRSYKKIHLIIADGLPIINIIFIIFRFIAKIFKISSINQKLTELLFENLKVKKTPLKINKNMLNIDNHSNIIKSNNQMSNNDIGSNKNNNDFSSVQYLDSKKKILFQNNDKDNNMSNYSRNANIQIVNNNYKGKEINRSVNSNLINEDDKSIKNININFKEYLCNKKDNINFDANLKNDFNPQKNDISKTNSIIIPPNNKYKTKYLKKKLFPYKYYLCSIFIKNGDISNISFFFTKKFIVVYNFICQLFDISSYLILQREFQTMKNTIIEEKERNIIEKGQKINVNESSFNMNMKECLDDKKLSIFGKIQQKNKNQQK